MNETDKKQSDIYITIKKTYRYRIYRFLWVYGRDISTWAGKKAIKLLKAGEKKDEI